jgi:hypothetical protein
MREGRRPSTPPEAPFLKGPLDSPKIFGAQILQGIRVARFRLWEITPARFPMFASVRYHATVRRTVEPCRFALMSA